jgi:hypothetical protein
MIMAFDCNTLAACIQSILTKAAIAELSEPTWDGVPRPGSAATQQRVDYVKVEDERISDHAPRRG